MSFNPGYSSGGAKTPKGQGKPHAPTGGISDLPDEIQKGVEGYFNPKIGNTPTHLKPGAEVGAHRAYGLANPLAELGQKAMAGDLFSQAQQMRQQQREANLRAAQSLSMGSGARTAGGQAAMAGSMATQVRADDARLQQELFAAERAGMLQDYLSGLAALRGGDISQYEAAARAYGGQQALATEQSSAEAAMKRDVVGQLATAGLAFI